MILLVGNWKMAPDKATDAEKLAKALNTIGKNYKKKLSLVVCPPFPYLSLVAKVTKSIKIGAQRVSPNTEVAHTGQVSAAMIKSAGASYGIVGHSEARLAGDTNERVREQATRLLEKKITPIICVGEFERDTQGWYLSSVKEQLQTVFSVVPKSALKNIVIAYEPIWSIGKDAQRVATAHECQEMVIYIRKVLSDMYDEKLSKLPKILYGGSVDEKNAPSFLTEGGAQGLLVGRVSLEPKRFAALAAAIVI